MIAAFAGCASDPTLDDGARASMLRRIAFVSVDDGNSDVFIVNEDGTGLTRLTSHQGLDGFPSWSPDGRRIAFVSDRDGTPEIYLMDANGRDVKRVTDNDIEESMLAWSPDGARLAFSGKTEREMSVFVLTLGQGTQVRLADGMAPSWSPDGSKIVFNRHNRPKIYMMNADGSNVRPMFDDEVQLVDLYPVWSPTHDLILFTTSVGPTDYDICVVRPDGTGRRTILANPGIDMAYDWSPTGREIVFASDRDGNFQIYRMNGDGTEVRRLTDDRYKDLWAKWGPGQCGGQ